MIASKRNLRFEVQYTHDFIRRFLPPGGRRLLEIGCGTGDLAARLTEDGFQVTAIDSDQELVAAAGQLGVNARVAEWPDFDDGHFDAVLFTRSLHHIQPLRDAVQHAAACLSESGRIIVEDFAYEYADEKTLRWLSSAVRLLDAAGLLVERDELLDAILREGASLALWQQHHDHDLSTAAEIETALTDVGGVLKENAAYYFRYLARAMGNLEKRDSVCEALVKQEEDLISNLEIIPLGRRFVVVP